MQTIKELQTEIREFFATKGYDEDQIQDSFKEIFFYGETYGDVDKEFAEKFNFEKVHFEGGEGQGDYAESVFKLGDRMFRTTAYYASYDGFSDNDGVEWEEVEPKQVLVTQYHSVQRSA